MRKKIAHIIETIEVGGAERRLLSDIEHIDRNVFDNTVFYLKRTKNSLKTDFNRAGVEAVCLEVPRFGFINFLKASIQLSKYLKEGKYDIVHTQLFWANLTGRLAAALSGVKTVFSTYQNPDYSSEKMSSLSLFRRLVLDRFTAFISGARYISVSNDVRDSVRKFLKRDSRVIHNSVDFYDFGSFELGPGKKDALYKELGITGKDEIFINIGRLHPQKGQKELIDAFSRFVKENENSVLLLVGRGPLETELKKQVADIGKDKNIRFLGFRSDIKELLSISKVFIMPSFYEGIPVALLEACATRKALVVSSIAPIKEVLKDNIAGCYVTAGDAEDIFKGLIKIVKSFPNPKELNNMYEKVSGEFDVRKNIKKQEDFYLNAGGIK